MPSPPDPSDAIYNFGLSATEFAWRDDACEKIRARREAMSGLLFFDILLKLGGIDNAAGLYPPSNIRELERLLDALKGASYDDMKRDCLIYYLLKQGCDGREVGYAREKVISPHYLALADAYWLLDSGLNLHNALGNLSDARIMKDYTSKIIETLSLDPESGELIRRYVRTCNPPLMEIVDMERYMLATAEYSLVEAWNYQRRLPDKNPIRKQLISKLLAWTVTPKPRPQPLTQLLAVPFSKFEETEVQDFATHPSEGLSLSAVTVLRDLVCVRLIQSCRFVAAVKFDRQYPSSGASTRGTWGAERERIVKEVLSIMPAAERSQLETELSALHADARLRTASTSWVNSAANGSANATMDLSSSWEDVGRRAANGPRSSISGRPISSRVSRPSLPNGSNALLSPFSSERPVQEKTGQPSLLSSQISPETNLSSPRPFSLSASTQSRNAAPASAIPRPRTSAAHAQTNGTQTQGNLNGKAANGSSKPNAFMTRNAFFNPPPARTPSPDIEMQMEPPVPSRPASSKRTATKLPTPPQDESDEENDDEQGSSTSFEPTSNKGGLEQAKADGRIVADESLSDHENLEYSLFAPPAQKSASIKAPAKRLTPSSGETSPKARRKSSRSASKVDHDKDFLENDNGSQRKKLKITVPGGFTEDDGDRDHTELPSPASVSGEQNNSRGRREASISSNISTNNIRSTPRRSTRKRAASPSPAPSISVAGTEDDDVDAQPISIPGGLMTSDDEINAFASAARRAAKGKSEVNGSDKQDKGKGRANEELDELAPLPSLRSQQLSHKSLNSSTASRSSRRTRASVSPGPTPQAASRTPRRGTRSIRGESTEPDMMGSVRRSSRLVDGAGASPVKKSASSGSNNAGTGGRPKKSTRTAGSGATATGRGATKRR